MASMGWPCGKPAVLFSMVPPTAKAVKVDRAKETWESFMMVAVDQTSLVNGQHVRVPTQYKYPDHSWSPSAISR